MVNVPAAAAERICSLFIRLLLFVLKVRNVRLAQSKFELLSCAHYPGSLVCMEVIGRDLVPLLPQPATYLFSLFTSDAPTKYLLVLSLIHISEPTRLGMI